MDLKEVKKKLILELLEKRVLYLRGEITHDTAVETGLGLAALNSKSATEPIELVIDSPGGVTDAGLDMYDVIRSSTAPVIGTVYRQADSIAAVVLQACKKRRMHRHSQIVLHSSSTGSIPLINLEQDIEKAIAKYRRSQDEIFKIFSERLERPVEEIKKIFGDDADGIRYSAEEAKAAGLIDEII